MRTSWQITVAALLLTAACADSPTTPPGGDPARTAALPASTASVRYHVVDLTPGLVAAGFDGQFSVAFELTSAGVVRGAASAGGYQQGFSWSQGTAMDVGSLGGPLLNAQAGGQGGDVISILSEVATADPLAEDFCGFHTAQACKPAVWRGGLVRPLPTLGGTNGAALTGNARGLLVGVAEDGVPDNSCIPPQKDHFQAAVWQGGEVHALPPLAGDQVGLALRANSLGQVVGTSGLCANTLFGGEGFGPHAVLWDHGKAIYLGNLGDQSIGVAAGINDFGQVVGAASAPDGSVHAFLWSAARGMRDLGLLGPTPADAFNAPTEINNRGQFVGQSCDPSFSSCRGYIWQNGAFTDLNALTTGAGSLYIVFPCAINDAGQIAGLAIDTITGTPHAFLATPVNAAVSAAAAAAGASASAARRVPLPPALRSSLARRIGLRRF